MTMRLHAGSDIETGALVLAGDPGSFRELARLLRGSAPAKLEVADLIGRPAIRPVGVLYLELADGPASISVSGDAATLSGGVGTWPRLADEIDLFLEHNDLTEPGMHVHIDASAANGNELLAIDSRDLILAGPIPDEKN